VSGAGAAGTAIVKLLRESGVTDIVAVDSRGILSIEREDLNDSKKELLELTNSHKISGGLAEAVSGRDVFIGVSSAGILTGKMVETMATDSIVFALANPTPEIDPATASSAGALVVATGRSDYPNQINNALVFPGVFRGLLDGRIKNIDITLELKVALALASCVAEPTPHKIIPDIFDTQVVPAVARAVSGL
jgi:malate dehydrogenase (oxaloacetate-decarboxylating)